MTRHPAYDYTYEDLLQGLLVGRDAGLISMRRLGDLEQFTYTRECQYSKSWNPFTIMARGLIIDTQLKRVVGAPFPKFFNFGEQAELVIPDEPFEATEKYDGSLIIIFWHQGEWLTATKGSFDSSQARAAGVLLRNSGTMGLTAGFTYLCEYVAPHNKIVISYPQEKLVLLGGYDCFGVELTRAWLEKVASAQGWDLAQVHEFPSIQHAASRAEQLPASEEGYVLRFQSGLRLKIKGAEYRRVHSLISRVTPLAIWEALAARDNMNLLRQQLPEEFWTDFDTIHAILFSNMMELLTIVQTWGFSVQHLSDKELGLALPTIPPPVCQFMFPFRKCGSIMGMLANDKTRKGLFRHIRPTGNILDGWVPSYAFKQVQENEE